MLVKKEGDLPKDKDSREEIKDNTEDGERHSQELKEIGKDIRFALVENNLNSHLIIHTPICNQPRSTNPSSNRFLYKLKTSSISLNTNTTIVNPPLQQVSMPKYNTLNSILS